MEFFFQAFAAIVLGLTPIIATAAGLAQWPRLVGVGIPIAGFGLAYDCYRRIEAAENMPRAHLVAASSAMAICAVGIAAAFLNHP
jgi:hypothetical protein